MADFDDDGCVFDYAKMWCTEHNRDCELSTVKTCAGCGEKFRYAHLDCKAIQAPVLRDGDRSEVVFSFDFAPDDNGNMPVGMWIDEAQRIHMLDKTALKNALSKEKQELLEESMKKAMELHSSKWDPVVLQETFKRPQRTPSDVRGRGDWYTTQTVLPNRASYEQRQELLRALREDPSMGSRGTKQFVAFIDKKKVTTAAAFDNAVDIGLLTDIRLEQRQDSEFQHGMLKCCLKELPEDEWVHVVIKPTRPNDLGILAMRRQGPLLQLHEVTSGARAKSEFPGVDRVVVLPA